MRLLVCEGDTTVEAIDAFENYLDPATGGVAFERVGAVLEAIRNAATGVRPAVLSPERLEYISSVIYENAAHVKALADKAQIVDAADPDAPPVLELLTSLGLA